MSENVDRLMDRWLNRIPDARRAYSNDPQYHAQIAWMRRAFAAFDLAMEDEGIPEQVRERILRTLLHGGPSEAEALQRMEALRSQVENLSAAPLAHESWQERYPMWRGPDHG